MATKSKQKRVPGNKQKLKLFRANESEKSVLMWGVNYSISQMQHVKPRAILLKDDFKSCMKVSIENNHFNKENMPSSYKFKEYCPLVFKDLRRRFNICEDMYLNAFIKRQPLRYLTGAKMEGKKSDLVTFDHRFVIRPFSSDNTDCIQHFIQSYYEYVVNCNGNTLLPHFIGMYRVTVSDQETYYVVQCNPFYPIRNVVRKYALSGTDKSDQRDKLYKKGQQYMQDFHFIQESVKLRVSEEDKQRIICMMKSDIQFLEYNKLHKFRIVVGIWNKENQFDEMDNSMEELLSESDSDEEGGVDIDDGQPGLMTPPDSPPRNCDFPMLDSDVDWKEYLGCYCAADKSNESILYFFSFIDTWNPKHKHHVQRSNSSTTAPYNLTNAAMSSSNEELDQIGQSNNQAAACQPPNPELGKVYSQKLLNTIINAME